MSAIAITGPSAAPWTEDCAYRVYNPESQLYSSDYPVAEWSYLSSEADARRVAELHGMHTIELSPRLALEAS